MANPSVRLSVRLLSVTRLYCVKTRERKGMWSSPSVSPLPLVFWCQEWFMGDDPVQIKFECKEAEPL